MSSSWTTLRKVWGGEGLAHSAPGSGEAGGRGSKSPPVIGEFRPQGRWRSRRGEGGVSRVVKAALRVGRKWEGGWASEPQQEPE